MSSPPRPPVASGDKLPAVLALLQQLQPAVERDDRARQNRIVEELLELAAPMGDQWQQLANMAAGNGELALARRAIDHFVDARGRSSVALYQKAAFLSTLEAWDEADALLRTLPEDVPDPVGNAYSRGVSGLRVGRIEEAVGYLDYATRHRPEFGHPWFSLTMAVDMAQRPELAERLIAAEPKIVANPMQQVPYYYALGKVHADRAKPAQAFAAYARGAQLMKSTLAYDQRADRAAAERAIAGYDADRISALARRQRAPTARTIFVTGLPRSGTTLLEQILTSHSTVGDGAEIARLPLLAREVGGASFDAVAGYVGRQGAEAAAGLWHHWLDELFPGPGRIVDKTVDAGRWLGLAATLLPEAPLIWLTRDPLDRAWSCFRTNFAAQAMPWSYDLADIAAHFRIEEALLDRWQDMLGERLLVVPYEGLATEPEPWIRRILAHCGLPEEPQVFAPHANSRAVATASMLQVRRPIGREAIGSAAPYRAFLQPFLDAYCA